MRFRSKPQNGYTISAVSGVHTVSFAIDVKDAERKGLLGFSVKRRDVKEKEEYFMPGFKVFESIIPNPTPDMKISTFDHPVQALVWDDFTAKPGYEYEYWFIPVKGKPKNLQHLDPVKITVQTEPETDPQSAHDVFFNRGVASSQAYSRKFHNCRPDQLHGAKHDQALAWLSRGLDQAILRFIKEAQDGDALRCCFYEFRYLPVLEELRSAIDRGVDVMIIYDAKENGRNGDDPFPKAANEATIEEAGLPHEHLIPRQANASNIQHNKFMVLLKGGTEPTAVWTGSTNISEGGIFGQTNVGHWVRNPDLAQKYLDYWELLSNDPGMQPGDDRAKRAADNKRYKAAVVTLEPDIDPKKLASIPQGVTPIFSPRSKGLMLETYAQLLATAKTAGCVTMAFGVNSVFKGALQSHSAAGPVVFMLLEKKDLPNSRSKDPEKEREFVRLTAENNVYQAWGSYIRTPLYQWTRETTTRQMRLNDHVLYVHTKFLLRDPLGDDPIIVTGSANFSANSTTANDENMIVIRGDFRAADIYFTEFMRIFNHYYFRAMHEEDDGHRDGEEITHKYLLLDETDGWLKAYKSGKLRAKRVEMFTKMKVPPSNGGGPGGKAASTTAAKPPKKKGPGPKHGPPRSLSTTKRRQPAGNRKGRRP